MKNFKEEIKLLIDCLRETISLDDLSSKRLNLDYIIKRANEEGVNNLLYLQLKSSSKRIPETIIKKLESEYEKNIIRELIYQKKFEVISENFIKEKIRFIPMKGMYLINIIKDYSLIRKISDIDILIKNEDIHKARDILLNLGYLPLEKEKESKFMKDNLALPFIDNDGGIIELHTHIINRRIFQKHTKVDMDEIWSSSLPFANEFLRKFSYEDGLIHLCLHFMAQHDGQGFIWLFDIKKYIEEYREKINRERFSKRIKLWSIGTIMTDVAFLFKDILNADLPGYNCINKRFRRKVLRKNFETKIIGMEYLYPINFIWRS